MIVEVLCPAEGTFVLGRDLLGVDLMSGLPDEWIDITSHATSSRTSTGGDNPFGFPETGTCTINLKDLDISTPWGIATPGRPLRIRAAELPGTPIVWTGRITDAPTSRTGTSTYTTLTASDILARAGSLPVSRPIPGDGTHETYIDELAGCTDTPIAFTHVDRGYAARAATSATAPAGITLALSLPTKIEARTARAFAAGETFTITAAFGTGFDEAMTCLAQFTLTKSWWAGFTPGLVEVRGVGGFEPVGTGPGTYTTALNVDAGTSAVEIRVTTPAVGSGGGIDFTALSLIPVEPATSPTLAASAAEGELADHLNRSCLTFSSGYRVDVETDGLEVLDVFADTPTLTLVDLKTGTPPRTAPYLDAQITHNTGGSFTNSLTLTNYEAQWDEEGVLSEATNPYTAENTESVLRVGRRPAEAATAHKTAAHKTAADETAPARHARTLLADLSADGWQPESASCRLKDLPDLPRVHDLVNVVADGVTYPVRISGLEIEATAGLSAVIKFTFRRR